MPAPRCMCRCNPYAAEAKKKRSPTLVQLDNNSASPAQEQMSLTGQTVLVGLWEHVGDTGPSSLVSMRCPPPPTTCWPAAPKGGALRGAIFFGGDSC